MMVEIRRILGGNARSCHVQHFRGKLFRLAVSRIALKGGRERKTMTSPQCRTHARGIALKSGRRAVLLAAMAASFLLVSPASRSVDELRSYAIIHDDATLEVAGRRLRLYGIFLPKTERTCEPRIRPVRCASRAVQALRFKVRGFVHCRLGGKFEDGSIAAYCSVAEQDLGEYLIRRGWAVALPDAPFSYHVSERIARQRGFGVWGFSVDRTTPEF